MKKMIGVCALACAAVAAIAQAQEDLMSKMINQETNGTWNILPEKPKPRHFKVDDTVVPGGYAFRVKARKGANPWDVQASSPIAGAIDSGDVIMLMYYARAEQPAEGGSQLTARIQITSPPWTSVLDFTAPISGEWKSYCAFRVSSAPIEAKKSNVSIHLATAEQVIDLGPVLVFNFGKDYDQGSWRSAMASRGARTIPRAVRELCLALPEVEEFEAHGAPNFRARKGKVFAMFAVNHHGDGHVALWLRTPPMEQSRLLQSAPRHLFKPPYVGPGGWIAVELNRGISWKRVRELTHMAYLHSSPAKLVARAPGPPSVAPPGARMKPADIDRLLAPRAQRMLALVRRICRALPETSEGDSFGSRQWRVGKKGFALLYDYGPGATGEGLRVSFWVGIERQGPLEMDPRFSVPPYLGHYGWMALDVSRGVPERELREYLIESYRHFATRRAIAQLEAQSS